MGSTRQPSSQQSGSLPRPEIRNSQLEIRNERHCHSSRKSGQAISDRPAGALQDLARYPDRCHVRPLPRAGLSFSWSAVSGRRSTVVRPRSSVIGRLGVLRPGSAVGHPPPSVVCRQSSACRLHRAVVRPRKVLYMIRQVETAEEFRVQSPRSETVSWAAQN
jgi:hypothetical protein